MKVLKVCVINFRLFWKQYIQYVMFQLAFFMNSVKRFGTNNDGTWTNEDKQQIFYKSCSEDRPTIALEIRQNKALQRNQATDNMLWM